MCYNNIKASLSVCLRFFQIYMNTKTNAIPSISPQHPPPTHTHTMPHTVLYTHPQCHTYKWMHSDINTHTVPSTSLQMWHQLWTHSLTYHPTSLTPAIKGPGGYTHHRTPVLPQPSKDPGGIPTTANQSSPAIKGPRGYTHHRTPVLPRPSKDPGGIPTTTHQSYPSHQRTQGVSYTHHPTPVLPQPSGKGPRRSVTPTTPHQAYPSHQAKDLGGHLWTAAVSVGRGSVCSWHPWCGCCATPASCSSWSPSLCWVVATWWCACCGPRSTHGPAHPHVAPSCNTPTLYSPFSAHPFCLTPQ